MKAQGRCPEFILGLMTAVIAVLAQSFTTNSFIIVRIMEAVLVP